MISYKPFSGYDAFKYYKDFKVLNNMSMLAEIVTSAVWSPIVWRDGVRKTTNFVSSKFLALDFDAPGEMTMDELNWSLQDHKRIIAITKSHMISKGGIVCDRFRLLIPFAETITDYAVYRHQYAEALKKYPWADKSCLDGARFFFPSKKIVHIDREAEYSWEIKPLPIAVNQSAVTQQIVEKPFRKIPAWCLRFINDGETPSGSRNMTLLGVCVELLTVGFTEAETRNIVLQSKINWEGIALEATLKSAKKKVTR